MTFTERLNNVVSFVVYQYFFRDMYILPKMEALVDKHFPDDPRPGRPSLLELESNAALAIDFGHPLLMDGLRPKVPNYIQMGMSECRPSERLPKDIEKFIDGAGDDGVILVAFGTVLQASQMAEGFGEKLVSVFRRLKQRVIWKWEVDEMPDKPDNVMLLKWLPQQDILGHPKLKLYINHGGQSGFQESLCHKKPMVT